MTTYHIAGTYFALQRNRTSGKGGYITKAKTRAKAISKCYALAIGHTRPLTVVFS